MRRIMILVVAALFVISAMPAFAQEQPKERNLFKIIENSFKPCAAEPAKAKTVVANPLPRVAMFQNVADGINKGSAEARCQSLRPEKAK